MNLPFLIDRFYKLSLANEKMAELLSQLSALETFKDRLDFAEKRFERLSSGSSRVIFTFAGSSGKEVLKLAKNKRGIAQNLVEGNPKMKNKFINTTLKMDKQGLWKTSPYLEELSEKDFEEMIGVPFKDFGEAISYGLQSVSGNKHEKPKGFEAVKETEIYKELVKMGKEFSLMGGDIGRISSFKQAEGHPVLVDAGLNREIYDQFYDRETGQPVSSKSTKSK